MKNNSVPDLRATDITPSVGIAQHEQKMDHSKATEDQDLDKPLRRPDSIATQGLAEPESISVADDYSVFSRRQKKVIIIIGSFAAFFSPVSSNIYFPALNTIAKDLQVSLSHINLTVTTYQVRTSSCC